ncbi:MAG: CYTH domain-containing protein [Bacteroidales bacterium]
MNEEIERKFLVSGSYKHLSFRHTHIMQGYISTEPERSVRIRIRGEKGYLTIKGISTSNGLSRFEWEKEISVEEAKQLMLLCLPSSVIEKIRYEIRHDNHIIEVDEFKGLNEGLILAEIELKSINDSIILPEWIGKEVTGDVRYYNSMLAQHPYNSWSSENK